MPKLIETLSRQESEDDDDDDPAQYRLQLGVDNYAYNPKRLVKDSRGNIIEEDKAPLSFILADLRRSSENVQRATVWNSRKARKAEHLDYVGRYTHRVAISNNRLVSMDDGKVRFRWKASSGGWRSNCRLAVLSVN
jgi:hypothetical protein